MNLSKSQIDYIMTFVEQKGVTFIDVKYELVDHLACMVEDIWVEYPNLSFERAFDRVIGSMPILAFSTFVEEKEKLLRRLWSKRLFGYVKTYLTWPKIALLCVVGIVVFLYIEIIQKYELSDRYLSIIVILAAISLFIQIKRERSEKAKMLRRRFLAVRALENSSFGFSAPALTYLIYIPFNMLNEPITDTYQLMFAIVIPVIGLIIFSSMVVFPRFLMDELELHHTRIATLRT